MKTKLLFTVIALLAISTMINAQRNGYGWRHGDGHCGGRGYAFVDNNKNGVCDNFENPKDSLANKNTYGFGQGKGRNFVDNNKNNICDYRENRFNGRRGNAYGRGNGKGWGRGPGRNFIDENKNGTCDRLENLNNK